MLWVEAQVLHWVNEDQSIRSSGSFTSVTKSPSEETSEGATPGAVEGRGSVHGLVARQLDDGTLTAQGTSQLGSGEGEPSTGPVTESGGDVALAGQETGQLGNGNGEPVTGPVTSQLSDVASTNQRAANQLDPNGGRPQFDPIHF